MTGPTWRRYLRFWRSDPRRDVEDELRFHFEARVEELVARGMPVDSARQEALNEFGDVASVREELVVIDQRMEQRHVRTLWLDNARQDIRYALRGIRRSPGLAATIILTLAVGIAAAGSMYGLMWRLLIQPAPHVVDPDRVVLLYQRYGKPGEQSRHVNQWNFSFLEHIARSAQSYRDVGAYSTIDVSLGSGSRARQVHAVAASGNYWRVLGVRPRHGRFFTETESHPVSGTPVAVLSHAFWREYFAEQDVIGRVVKIKGLPYEVIGVAPRGFRGVELEQVDVWLPLMVHMQPGASVPWHQSPFGNDLRLIARLEPRVESVRAQSELTSLMRPFFAAVNAQLRFSMYSDSLESTVASLTSELGRGAEGRPESKVAAWLVGVGMVLLAVACTNVAGLLLLRSMRRRREIALRSALGMSRRRLVTLLLTEIVILATLGGVASIGLLLTAGAWLERIVFPHLSWEPASPLSPSILIVVGAGILGTFAIAGLVSLQHAGKDVARSIREGGQHGSTRRSRTHRVILVAQTTLSVLLLVGAALFIQSLRNLMNEDLGVDAQRVFSVRVDFAGSGRSRADINAFYERARERLVREPGVELVGLAADAPLLRSARSGGRIALPGHDTSFKLPGQGNPTVNYVSPEFFETTGMAVLRGRAFQESDRDSMPVVIMNQTMANLYWPNQDAIGQCVHLQRQPTCTTVIGVVETQRMFQIREEPHLYYYRPLYRTGAEIGNLLMRTSMSPARTMLVAKRALLDVEPELPYVDVSELVTGLEAELRPWRLGVTIFTGFGVLAMLLAAIGLASSISYSVTERSREIGVRIAVGARRWHVLALVLREGLAIGVAGVIAGVAIAVAAAPWLGDLLYKVSPRDALTFVIVGAVVLLIVLLASASPARRASRIHPMRVLSSD